MGKIIEERETRVTRTYRGGKLLDAFLGKEHCEDSFFPEDWISSFTEAKNKVYLPGEGITRTKDGRLLPEAVPVGAFGQGRTEPGVLIKLLDSAERLGIQVHPTDAYARRLFGSPWGKTECWHILATRTINGESPKIYLGFRPHITRTLWEEYYRRQDVSAMLAGMNEIAVQPGDTVLVRGGMPHAIGAGCLLLEIQQPSDYTMRCETVPLSGEPYTPQQIHYGAGEAAMLDCFDYTPQAQGGFLLPPRKSAGDGYTRIDHVTYADTPCFALSELSGGFSVCEPCFVTAVCLCDGGTLESEDGVFSLHRGDKYFIPADTAVSCRDCRLLLCYPPEIGYARRQEG